MVRVPKAHASASLSPLSDRSTDGDEPARGVVAGAAKPLEEEFSLSAFQKLPSGALLSRDALT